MNDDLKRSAVKSVKITMASSVLSLFTQAGILVVLARLLSPSDYGHYAIGISITRLTAGLVIGATERALIASRQIDADELDALVPSTLIIATSLLAGSGSAIMLGSSADGALPVVLLMLTASVPQAFALTSRVVMRRGMRYGPLAIADTAGQVLGTGLVTVLAALLGYQHIALGLGVLAQSSINAMVVLFAQRPKFASAVSVTATWQVAKETAKVSTTAFAEIVASQLPTMLIGSVLGVTALGLFNRIYSLVQLPVEILTNSITRVLVSGLVAARDDAPRLNRAFLSMVTIACVMILPIAAGVLGAAREFILATLGPTWAEGISFTPAMALTTAVMMTTHLFAIGLEVLGRFYERTIIQMLVIVFMAIAMWVGALQAGLDGAVIGFLLSQVFSLIINMVILCRYLGMRIGDAARRLSPGLIGGVLVGTVATILSMFLSGTPVSLALACQIAACGIVLLTFLIAFERALLLDLLGYVGLRSLIGRE